MWFTWQTAEWFTEQRINSSFHGVPMVASRILLDMQAVFNYIVLKRSAKKGIIAHVSDCEGECNIVQQLQEETMPRGEAALIYDQLWDHLGMEIDPNLAKHQKSSKAYGLDMVFTWVFEGAQFSFFFVPGHAAGNLFHATSVS